MHWIYASYDFYRMIYFLDLEPTIIYGSGHAFIIAARAFETFEGMDKRDVLLRQTSISNLYQSIGI